MDRNKIKIGIILKKSSMMKCWAPVLKEIIKQDISLTIFSGPKPKTSFSKNPEQRPIKENLNFPGIDKSKIVYFNDYNDLNKNIKKEKINQILTSDIRKEERLYDFLKTINKEGVKIHYLQFYGDFVYQDAKHLDILENFFVYGSEIVNIYKKTYPHIKHEYLKKIKCVGNPNLDFLTETNQDQIKHKYNIPKNKKIILFFSTILTLDYWRQNIFAEKYKIKSTIKIIKNFKLNYLPLIIKPNYRDIIKSIKKFAYNNNCLLIVKTKIKHKDPQYIIESADYIFSDYHHNNNWYPPTSLELISISDLIISMSFSVTLESISLNKPCVQILDPTQKNNKKTTYLNESIINNFSENIYFKDYTNFTNFIKNQSIDHLRSKKILNPKIVSFFGNQPEPVSKKIIDEILKNS